MQILWQVSQFTPMADVWLSNLLKEHYIRWELVAEEHTGKFADIGMLLTNLSPPPQGHCQRRAAHQHQRSDQPAPPNPQVFKRRTIKTTFC